MAIVLSGTTNDITVNGVSVATDAEVSTALAGKANTADLKEIGVEQTWQNVTASRVLGTTYTNSTGKPIMVACRLQGTVATSLITLTIGGVDAVNSTSSAPYAPINCVVGIVPNNTTYSIASANQIFPIWTELR